MDFDSKTKQIWIFLWITILVNQSNAGISYQSVSFVHSPPKIRQFRPISPPFNINHNHNHNHYQQHQHHLQYPPISSVKFFENNLQHALGDELWPASIFEEPVDFLDITLNSSPFHAITHPRDHPHHQIHSLASLHSNENEPEHDFINKLELPPDPYLLTGYRAKQAANYLYSHELFYKDIPHAKALLKLQEKRLANGLPPNRLGSINIRSPFNRDKSKHFAF